VIASPLAANDELVIDVDRPGHIRVAFHARDLPTRPPLGLRGTARRQVIEEPSDAPDPKSFELVVTFPPGVARPGLAGPG